MHWADKVAKEIIDSGKYKPYWVDDMKTPSGFAHIGSMLGPIIHSCLYRALIDAGQEATLTYVFNDFDAADEFPPEFKEKLSAHFGEPLRMVPSPDANFKNLADFLTDDLKKSLEALGFEAKYLSSWDMYHEGKFDGVIREALDAGEKIQEIYQKVSGSNKREQGWLPFQVICENCGKLGTTKVTGWDGEKVTYKCEPNLVTWAKGCSHIGKISPFGGNGKLPWKVDWAAHWKVIDVTIEGAGKDHASAGGSYDIAMALCREVFNYPPPFKLPYEFLLIGGKKMSSSKGLGLKAHDIVKILPPEIARYLFVRKDYKEQYNFDPFGTDAIPDLFDDYDEAWKAYIDGEKEDLARTFVLSQIKHGLPVREKILIPRFREVANYLSQGLAEDEVKKKFSESPNDLVAERIKYAKVWLENYAPPTFKFEMTKEIPETVRSLTGDQKKYLKEILPILELNLDADKLQIDLFELSKKLGIKAKDAFAAIYISLLGKDSGPRAGILLTNFGKEKVAARIADIMKEGDKK
jgi:lysyl-tRNA synthetase class 1